MNKKILRKIEELIARLDVDDQKKLLQHLPHILKLSWDDLFVLKAAQGAFEFWDNPDDAIYDDL